MADFPAQTDWSQALILAPPSARGSRWMARFEPYGTAFASGWTAKNGQPVRALNRLFEREAGADVPVDADTAPA